MSFDSEYLALRKKRKKEEEKKKATIKSTKNTSSQKLITDNNDIAPVLKTFTPDTTIIAPVKTNTDSSDEGLFKKPDLFSDGYQRGDVVKTILGTTGDLTLNTMSGAGNYIEGIADAIGYGVADVSDSIGANDFAERIREKTKESITQKILGNATSAYNKWSVSGNTLDSVAQGLGMVGTSIMGGKVLGGIGLGGKALSAGTTTATALSGYGSGTSEAYEGGATDKEARVYGMISGASEALTELLFGGLGKTVNALGFSKGLSSLDDMFAKKVSSMFSNQIAKNLVEFGIKSSAEGIEEVLSGIAQGIGKKITYMSEEDIRKIMNDEKLLEQFVVGSVTSSIAQAGDFIKATSEGKDFITGSSKTETTENDLTENEKKVVEKEVENRIAEKEEGGKKVSKKEKDKIYNEVVKALDEGDISIDTIESVLGGDTYKSYKDTVDSETALQKEFNTLNKMKQGEMTGEQIDRRAELKSQLEKVKNNSNSSKLKEQLSNEVYTIAKDSRLVESYNEVSRRKEAFTADLSKYDKKQQTVIQKAIDSGILNNTNKTHKFVDFIAKVSADKGVSFDFSNSEKLKASGFSVEGRTINGLVTEDGTVIINANSSKALDTVVGHEIMHLFEGTEFYNAIAEAVVSLAKTKGEYQTRYDEITKLYENVKTADVNKELVADLVGDYLFSDSEFIERLSTEHRNVFQKIYDEIKYFCKIAAAGSKEARELEKVRKAFEKAYRNAEVTKNTAEGGVNSTNIKFSFDFDKYPYNMQTVISEYIKSVDNTLLSIVEKTKSNYPTSFERHKISDASNKLIDDIKTHLNIDVTDYENAVNTNALQHIIKRHGENGEADSSMANSQDIARMGYIIDNYDTFEVLRDNDGNVVYSEEFRNADNTKAPMIRVSKKINGTYYVVEAVPESKYKKIWVSSAYINNGSAVTQAPENSGSYLTSPTSANTNIPQKPKSVNAKDVFGFKINENAKVNEDLLEELSIWHPDAQVDTEGNITVYHRTSKANADKIRKTGVMTAKEDALFFSSKPEGYASDYGDTVLSFKIPSTVLQVNDIFDGEVHFDMPLKYKNGGFSADVSRYLIDDNANVKENQNVQFSLSNNIEKVDEILYNKNNPLSIVNRAKTNNNSSLKWVYDAEIFSVEESKLFHEKISEINTGRHSFGNNKNTLGEYMIPIGNKIVFTDGNYDSPYVREIVEVLTELDDEFEKARERIFNVEKGKSEKQDTVRTLEQMFGKGFIVTYRSGNDGVYDWQNGQRKGKSRSSVIKNHFRKQLRARNDKQSKETPINEIAPIKEASSTDGAFFDGTNNNFSLSSERAEKKYGNVYGEDILLEKDDDIAPVKEDVKPLKNEQVQESAGEGIEPIKKQRPSGTLLDAVEDDIPVREDVAPVREDIALKHASTEKAIDAPIKTVEERLAKKIKNYQTELANNQRLLEKSNAEFDKQIAEEQAKYDAKKKKDTKAANAILRRIEELKRRKSNIAADFSKRISDIEGRITRADGKLLSYQEGMNNEQTDRLERYKKRSAARLEADKKVLTEEYEQKKAELQKKFKDENTYISNKARRLYDEAKDMKKGKRVSKELGFFLDLRREFDIDYPEFQSNLFHVSRHPDTVINTNSKMEATIRDELSKEFQAGAKEFEELDSKFSEKIKKLEEDAQKKLDEFEIANKRMTKQAELEEQMADLIGDTSTWRDKKTGLQYKVNTLRRNLRDIVRDNEGNRDIAKADRIYDELQGKYNQHEAELFREANRIKKPFAKLEITKAEDKYIQMLGELRNNPDTTLSFDTVEEFYEENQEDINKDKVEKVIKEARIVYDELLVRVNEVLKEHGMREIPRREGYFPHFTEEKQGFLGKLFNWKTQNNDIPTDIAGMTENFNPTRSWQSFNKPRTGDDTVYSFTKGLDTYVHGALDWIYHIEDLQKRRAFENHIRYIHSEQGIKEQVDAIKNSEEYDADTAQKQIELVYQNAKNPLNNFVTDFRTATNTLAAKKSSMDRGMEEATNRKVYSTMTNISNRVSANHVAGSVSSALTNFIPITQSWAEVSPVSSVKAMKQAIASYFRDDGMVDKSNFLTTRLRAPENLYKTTWDKVSEKVGFLMEAVDDFTSQTVWRSKYIENISNSMSENEAIKNADQFAENVMAGRSRGNNPTLFDSKNPLTKIFTAFQLEVSNEYGYMLKDMPQDIGEKSKAKLIKGYASMFFGAYAYNAIYSFIVGRDAAFDPVGIIEDVLQDLGVIGDDWLPKEILEALGLLDEDDEEEEIAPFKAISTLTSNIFEEVPFIGGLLGGGRIPISAGLPYGGNVSELIDAVTQLGTEFYEDGFKKTIEDKKWVELAKEIFNPLYYIALPMGGGQLKKSIEGASMYLHDVPGSYTDSGNLRFPVDEDAWSKIQAGIFGQYANENAQTYFDEGYAPLKEKQIQEYVDADIPIKDYWKYREGLSGLKTQKEKRAYINSLDISNEQKNTLKSYLYDEEGYKEDNPEKYAFLEKEGIGYLGYKELDEDTQQAWSWAFKHQEQYEHLKKNGVYPEDYTVYQVPMLEFDNEENEAYMWEFDYPEKASLGKVIDGGVTQYRKYSSDLFDIKADKDSNGDTVSGSAKKKKLAYIDGLDIDDGQKAILIRSLYDGKADKNKYNPQIIRYLNERNDISYEDKITILKELDIEVDSDGNVSW